MEGRTGLEMHWGWKVQTCEAKVQNLKKFSIPHKSYQHDSKIFHHSPSCKSNWWSYRQGKKIWMQCGHKTGVVVIRNRPVVVTKPIPNKGGSTPPKHPPSSSATYLSGWESKRRRWVSSCQTPSQCFRVFQLFKNISLNSVCFSFLCDGCKYLHLTRYSVSPIKGLHPPTLSTNM